MYDFIGRTLKHFKYKSSHSWFNNWPNMQQFCSHNQCLCVSIILTHIISKSTIYYNLLSALPWFLSRFYDTLCFFIPLDFLIRDLNLDFCKAASPLHSLLKVPYKWNWIEIELNSWQACCADSGDVLFPAVSSHEAHIWSQLLKARWQRFNKANNQRRFQTGLGPGVGVAVVKMLELCTVSWFLSLSSAFDVAIWGWRAPEYGSFFSFFFLFADKRVPEILVFLRIIC